MLAVGPLLYRVARVRSRGLGLVDGFIVVAITGLLLFGVLPESVDEGGWWSLLFGIAGLLGPTVLEKVTHGAVRQTHAATMGLVLLGLGAHALIDGAALNVSRAEGHEGSVLPLAVILHRLPVSLTIWWLLRPAGIRTPLVALATLAGATVAGFAFGSRILFYFDGHAMGWFEALVAGSLLHVVLHRRAPSPSRDGFSWDEGVGAVAGILLLVFFFWPQPAGVESVAVVGIWETFLGLALESAGPLLLAYLMAGLVAGLLPSSVVSWMGRGRPFGQSLRGMLVGLPFPVCSCGVVPVYRAFNRRGVPATAAMAFLIATPELGLDAVLLSIPLLGPKMTLIRVLGAAVVALLVGWLVGRITHTVGTSPDGDCGNEIGSDAPLAERLRSSVRTGFGEVVDHTGAWIILGLALAAVVQPLLEHDWFRAIPPGPEVLLFALLGLPTYVCASGATPLVAVLLFSGASPGAALAFLLTGPATNVTTFGVLSTLHGRRIALTFVMAMISVAVLLGLVVNLVLPEAGNVPTLPLGAESASPFQWGSLWVLGLIYAFSLLRLGARRFFFENLLPDPQLPGAHSHEDAP